MEFSPKHNGNTSLIILKMMESYGFTIWHVKFLYYSRADANTKLETKLIAPLQFEEYIKSVYSCKDERNFCFTDLWMKLIE